ncbi:MULTISPECIES: GGDEF domain-containing protein [unclassified Vibrio]|uniref:GGDEF domain-containing protein n=1 Tax=unclassified Vibrio TaxID=2614977 RepID=UPI000B8E93CC|nr:MULTISPECIES: GGDEF domain-containing protein [unclassified Vibrio]NAW89897.1 diguanylate cyclase [Vibrio sp. V24_P1S3T111]OXX25117.1 GGDEF domain-containing protein [Vibrio sp. V06_P1A73T115]OXX26132.1 GGDEF domain-containing protein [Vibrio sp. V05_P4A8T149]OXX31989.1 GGDEF domain-containing protein [Vibrio sp. V04_P4A5T148]OXX36674.1 GGDEF domain-containing protein [Vibrio sp. V14_P6S14T42]
MNSSIKVTLWTFIALGFSVINAYAAMDPKDKFLQALEGIEQITYSLPIKAKAQISELEEDYIILSQPSALVVRYYLAKATVYGLLEEYDRSLEAAQLGLKRTEHTNVETLTLKLREIQALRHQKVDVLPKLDALLVEAGNDHNAQIESEVLLAKSLYYQEQGEFKKSYAAIMTSIDTAKSIDNKELMERISHGLGQILVQLQDFDRSQLLLENSYSYFKQRKMSYSQLVSLLDISKLQESRNQITAAIETYKTALKLAQILGDGRHRFRINIELARLYRDTNNRDQMRFFLKKAEELQYRESQPGYVATFQLLQTQDLLEQKRYGEVIEFVEPLIAHIKQRSNLLIQQIELLKVAAQAYAGQNNYKQAYETYDFYHLRSLTLRNVEQVENLQRQQMLFDLERLQYENQDLNWNNVLQKLEIENHQKTFHLLGEIVFFLALALIGLLVIFIWANRSRIKMGMLAKTDTLTGLYNRRYMEERFAKHQSNSYQNSSEALIKLAQRILMWQQTWFKGQSSPKKNAEPFDSAQLDEQIQHNEDAKPISLILTDIDYFKVINDTYGHAFGDQVLVETAAIFKSSVRSSDVVARYGGEEFLILLPDTDLSVASEIAETLRRKIEDHDFVTESRESVSVTSSFGVLSATNTDLDLQALCEEVDQLLYAAKASGRNCLKTRWLTY